MLKSVATSFAFLPLLTSFITASQSTLVEAKAGRALVVNATVVMSIAEAAAIANFLVNIFFLSPFKFRIVSNDAQRISKCTSRQKNSFPGLLGYWLYCAFHEEFS